MISESFKKYKESKIQYPPTSDIRVIHNNEWGKVIECRYGKRFGYEKEPSAIIKVKHHFGFVKDYLLDEIEPWTDLSISTGFWGKFLCSVGFHRFEKQPSRKDLLKNDGRDFLFWTAAIQKGIKSCRREGCKAEKKVYRSGLCGAGGGAGRWSKLNPEKEVEIDSLPVL